MDSEATGWLAAAAGFGGASVTALFAWMRERVRRAAEDKRTDARILEHTFERLGQLEERLERERDECREEIDRRVREVRVDTSTISAEVIELMRRSGIRDDDTGLHRIEDVRRRASSAPPAGDDDGGR